MYSYFIKLSFLSNHHFIFCSIITYEYVFDTCLKISNVHLRCYSTRKQMFPKCQTFCRDGKYFCILSNVHTVEIIGAWTDPSVWSKTPLIGSCVEGQALLLLRRGRFSYPFTTKHANYQQKFSPVRPDRQTLSCCKMFQTKIVVKMTTKNLGHSSARIRSDFLLIIGIISAKGKGIIKTSRHRSRRACSSHTTAN